MEIMCGTAKTAVVNSAMRTSRGSMITAAAPSGKGQRQAARADAASCAGVSTGRCPPLTLGVPANAAASS